MARKVSSTWDEIEFREGGVSKAWLPVYGQNHLMLCEIDAEVADREDIGPYKWAIMQVNDKSYRIILASKRHPYRQKHCIKGSVYMSRVILDAPRGMIVDHSDHNTLNNKRSNLRLCTNSQNQLNLTGPRRHSKTGILGVMFNSRKNSYDAVIRINGNRYSKTGFSTKEEARAARIELEEMYAKEWSPRTKKTNNTRKVNNG